MPDWGGLGYMTLAGNLANQNANRSLSAWQQVLDLWDKKLATAQSQDWTLNKLNPQQQGYATDLQSQADKAALERGAAGDTARSTLQDIMNKFTGEQNALDRAAQDKRDAAQISLGWGGVNKKDQPKDMLTYLTSAAYITYGLGDNGVFGGFPSITDESQNGGPTREQKLAALRDQFAIETQGDPRQAEYLSAFDRQAKGFNTANAANELVKQGVNKVTADSLAGAVAKVMRAPIQGAQDAIKMLATVFFGAPADKQPAIKNWMNGLVPGLGDRVFNFGSGSPVTGGTGVPQFGAGTQGNYGGTSNPALK